MVCRVPVVTAIQTDGGITLDVFPVIGGRNVSRFLAKLDPRIRNLWNRWLRKINI